MIIKLVSSVIVSLGLIVTAHSQENINAEAYLQGYVASADSLLKISKSLSATEAKNAATLVGEKAKIRLKKVSKKVLSPHAIYELSKQATVVIGSAYLCPRCAHTHVNPASGYIIDASGIVVTNYHVVNVYANMRDGNKPLAFLARMHDGRTYPVKAILAASEQDDLAIIQLDTDGHILPAFSIAKKAEIGDPVYVLGHPHNLFYHFSQGNVTHKNMEKTPVNGNTYDRNFMLISADYGVGSSGGPVMDQSGNIVGTVSATQPLNYSTEHPVVQMILKKTIPVESLWKLIQTK